MKKSLEAHRSEKKALIDGLAIGFSFPVAFFLNWEIRAPSEFDVSAEKAWSDVGKTMRGVIKGEAGLRYDKTIKEVSGKRRIAA